jgi:hypothetical protein
MGACSAPSMSLEEAGRIPTWRPGVSGALAALLLQMVRLMIGSRGGSSGEQYLQGGVNRNHIFKGLSGIVTFLIERCNLSALPLHLHQPPRSVIVR